MININCEATVCRLGVTVEMFSLNNIDFSTLESPGSVFLAMLFERAQFLPGIVVAQLTHWEASQIHTRTK